MAFLTTVIPAYNAEKFIEETLDSVACQTRPPDRLIILDNCSTDNTWPIVRKFQAQHPKVNCEWRRNEANIGVIANFNRAFDIAAKTDFLHVLSADDAIKPQFFARLLPELEGIQGRGLVHSHLEFIDETGRIIPPFARCKADGTHQLTIPQFLRRQSELRHVYCQSVILRTARQPTPFHFETDWQMAGDVVFFSQWATVCERIVEVKEPLCRYRLHKSSTTGGNMLKLEAWVLEEWRAMRRVAELMSAQQGTFDRWLHEQRQRCIFAARSKVKMQQMQGKHPDYTADIRQATLEITGLVPWVLGSIAVAVRDLLWDGKATADSVPLMS